MINKKRLFDRIWEISRFGKLPNGGVTRLALSQEDKAARDLLKKWMKEAGLEVKIDQVGNMYGIWGELNKPAIAIGSHLDSVKEGGNYDGPLGVLGALEVVQSMKEAGVKPRKPVVVINFTNEEGVRFTPDMMGSLTFAKGISVNEVWETIAQDNGTTLKDALDEIGYLGADTPGEIKIEKFLEIHIEQGPVLEAENIDIGAVSKLQGIFWTEYHLHGKASHAGTTPINMRKDAGFVAGSAIRKLRRLAKKYNGVGTVGLCDFSPSQINATSETVRLISDIRHQKIGKLEKFQSKFDKYVKSKAEKENVDVERKELVRFAPVEFDREMVDLVIAKAGELKFSVKEMTSGAGHDAQMMQRVCPSTMIFIPSKDGLSHNPKEHSSEKDIEKGVNLLFEVARKLCVSS